MPGGASSYFNRRFHLWRRGCVRQILGRRSGVLCVLSLIYILCRQPTSRGRTSQGRTVLRMSTKGRTILRLRQSLNPFPPVLPWPAFIAYLHQTVNPLARDEHVKVGLYCACVLKVGLCCACANPSTPSSSSPGPPSLPTSTRPSTD